MISCKDEFFYTLPYSLFYSYFLVVAVATAIPLATITGPSPNAPDIKKIYKQLIVPPFTGISPGIVAKSSGMTFLTGQLGLYSAMTTMAFLAKLNAIPTRFIAATIAEKRFAGGCGTHFTICFTM